MSGITSTVTIGSAPYVILGSVARFTDYLAGSFQNGALIATLTATQVKQILIEATRIFNRTPWMGAQTTAGQAPGAWPRTGVTDREGNAIASDVIPLDIEHGAYELAAIVANDADTQSTAAGDNLKRIKAGPVELEKFRPTFNGRFALPVQELVGQYLGGGSGMFAGGFASGTDTPTMFDDTYGGAGVTDTGPSSE